MTDTGSKKVGWAPLTIIFYEKYSGTGFQPVDHRPEACATGPCLHLVPKLLLVEQ
jgi:hypothetical protein